MPELRHIIHQTFTRDPGEAFYKLFDAQSLGVHKPVCVFSGIGLDRTSSINAAEIIVDAICTKEGIVCEEYSFCDLQTHLGYRQPSGYYEFSMLEFDRGKKRYSHGTLLACGTVVNWQPLECPLIVFQAFTSLIGDFPELTAFINRSQECYEHFTDEELSAELDWAKSHLAPTIVLS